MQSSGLISGNSETRHKNERREAIPGDVCVRLLREIRVSNNVLDNLEYVEHRMRCADEAEQRVNALAAQSARRHMAIVQAIRRVRAVSALNKDRILTRANLDELLREIASDLEKSNRVRSTDMEDAE